MQPSSLGLLESLEQMKLIGSLRRRRVLGEWFGGEELVEDERRLYIEELLLVIHSSFN
jgi:hypothetical protein